MIFTFAVIFDIKLCPLCPSGEGEVGQGTTLLHKGLDLDLLSSGCRNLESVFAVQKCPADPLDTTYQGLGISKSCLERKSWGMVGTF